MEKIIKFNPAFDKRNPDPSKDYGIHCMEMHMVLKGSLGAISFSIYTGWYLEHIDNHFEASGAAVCYHSPVAKYEDQTPREHKCEYLDGNIPCYSDCTYIGGHDLFIEFVAKGEDYVWQALERRYIGNFGELK
jgi:hypothetical protein